MLFSRKAIGVEIVPEGLRLVLLADGRATTQLEAWGEGTFPAGTLRNSLREPNVLQAAAFVQTLRETHLKLGTGMSRVSVSLPDATGRVMIHDLETRYRNKQEGIDVLRWKLKKIVPFDINEAHLDFQELRQKDTGEMSVLVSLVTRQVVTQYEELFLLAGLEPTRIDFTSFNQYRLFADRLQVAENYALASWDGGMVSLLIFYGGILEFYRAKEIPGNVLDANRIYREINSSLLVHQDKNPGHTLAELYFCAPVEAAETFQAILAEVTGLQPVPLEVERAVALKGGVRIERRTLQSLGPSLGAALRNLP